MLPRGVDQRDDVVDQFGLDVNSGGLVLHGDQLVARKHLTDGLQWIDALPGEHHIALILRCGISDGQPYGEPVHLRIRQQLRTGSAGWVLRGKDDERLRDRMADAVNGDLPLLHGLEQRRLRAGRRPVELIREEQIAEHCAGLIYELAALLLIDGIAGDIGRQHVRRKLHAPVIEPQRAGKRQRHGRLADARNILEQHMAPGQQHRQHPDQNAVLAAYRFFDFFQNSACLIQASASFSRGDGNK